MWFYNHMLTVKGSWAQGDSTWLCLLLALEGIQLVPNGPFWHSNGWEKELTMCMDRVNQMSRYVVY